MLNKILVAAVAILTVAVIYLFATMPSSGEKTDNGTTTEKNGNDGNDMEVPTVDLTGDGKVVLAYVDGEMVEQKYLFLLEGSQVLGQMEQESQKRLYSKMQAAAAREKQIQSQNMEILTNKEKENYMRELQGLQKGYQDFEQQEMAKLQTYRAQMEEKLYMNVQEVLDVYCEKNHIDYVFNYRLGGPFLYVNKANNITVDVLTTLNEKYQKEKAAVAPGN